MFLFPFSLLSANIPTERAGRENAFFIYFHMIFYEPSLFPEQESYLFFSFFLMILSAAFVTLFLQVICHLNIEHVS